MNPGGSDIEGLVACWREAESVAILTGAGLSTASGIPDFRSPGGRWESYQPVTIQEFLASERSREDYWRYKGETWEVLQAAEPNAAHVALAALTAAGQVDLVVTQNVDGLHERSGLGENRLVNIHGTDSRVACVECGKREPRDAVQRAWSEGVAVPRCECGGAWKPDTISFGQSLISEDLERAFEAAERATLLVAAGSSLVVSPINQMFDVACRAGATTAILTRSETPYDARADYRVDDDLVDVLPRIAKGVLG